MALFSHGTVSCCLKQIMKLDCKRNFPQDTDMLWDEKIQPVGILMVWKSAHIFCWTETSVVSSKLYIVFTLVELC